MCVPVHVDIVVGFLSVYGCFETIVICPLDQNIEEGNRVVCFRFECELDPRIVAVQSP